MALPFLDLAQNSPLTIHRGLNVISILLSLVLLFRILKLNQVNTLGALAIVSIWGNELFYSQILATKPDAVGLLTYPLAIIIPYREKFSRLSLLASSCAAALSLFIKQYYILAAVPVFVYLVIRRQYRSAFIYLMSTGLLVLGGFLFAFHFGEAWIVNGVLAHIILAGSDFVRMRTAFEAYMHWYLPLIALLLTTAYFAKKRNIKFGPISFEYIALLVATLALTKLGEHHGNYLTYHIELFAPLALWCLGTSISRFIAELKLSYLLPLFQPYAAVTLFIAYSSHRAQITQTDDSWNELTAIVSNNNHNLYDGMLAGFVVEKKGLNGIIDGGLTAWCNVIKKDSLQFEPLRDAISKYVEQCENYYSWLTGRALNGEFEIVLRPTESDRSLPKTVLEPRYRREKSLELSFGSNRSPFEIWIRKTPGAPTP